MAEISRPISVSAAISSARRLVFLEQARVLDRRADTGRGRRQQSYVVVAEAAFLSCALHADHANRLLVSHAIGTPRYDLARVPIC